jgi:hypothetical protein
MNGCSSRQDGRKPDAGPGGGPGSTGDTPGPDTPTPPDANADALVDLAKVVNLDRFPGLTEEHRRRLAEDGFFVVPSTALAPFQLYERNERLGLPSYVTPELVVDAYRAVLASVERDVELSFAAPALHRALAGLVQRGIELRRFSLGDRRDDIEALDRAIAVFAVAARLLSAGELRSALPTDGEGRVEGEEAEAHAEVGRVPLLVPLDDLPSPTLPAPADAMFQEAMSRIRAADGVYATVVLEREADFRVFGVAERAEPGRAQALVRTLVWLDLACPAAAGDLADNLTGSLVLRLLADAESSGEPVRDLWRRATLLLSATGRVLAGTEPLPAVEAFRAQVADGGTLPPSAGASIRAVLAVPGTPPRGTLGLIGGRIDPSACAGCDDDLLWIGPAAPTGAVWAALQDEAATSDGAAAAERVHPASWAGIVESWNGWSARVLRRRPELPSGGVSADCLPGGAVEVRGAVAPARELLQRVVRSIAALQGVLRGLRVLPESEIEVPAGPHQEVAYRLQELLGAVDRFARVAADIVETDAAGRGWTPEQVGAVARIGGWTESILGDAGQVDTVVPSDPRWAALDTTGDVYGVGGVDVLYVVIPTREGLALARGAAYAYYEKLEWPFSPAPVTDEAWRTWLESPTPPARPESVASVVAPPLAPPPLVDGGTRRCLGPDSGGDLEL